MAAPLALTDATDRHAAERFVFQRQRFGGFSQANKILTSWQRHDGLGTEQYEPSQVKLCHPEMEDGHCKTKTDLVLMANLSLLLSRHVIQRRTIYRVDVWMKE